MLPLAIVGVEDKVETEVPVAVVVAVDEDESLEGSSRGRACWASFIERASSSSELRFVGSTPLKIIGKWTPN